MRSQYLLSLVCGFGLAGFVAAQPATNPAPAPAPAAGQNPNGQGALTPALSSPQGQGAGQTGQTNSYPTSLYRMNGVNKSLNLTPQQMNSLNNLTEKTQAQYRADYDKLNSMTGAERDARLQELNQQYNTAWNQGANSVFNANQRTRYQQMNNQYGGFETFNNPDIQKSMKLTADQRNELRTQQDWSNKQMADINRIQRTDPTKAAQMYQDYVTQRQERMNKFLNPEQQKDWEQMTGEPYNFAPSSTVGR